MCERGRRGGWMRRYDALALLQYVKAIGGEIRQYLFDTGGPGHLYLLCARARSQAEVQPQVILRQIAAATAHLILLNQVSRRHLHTSVECQRVSVCPMEFETDPVILRIRICTQDHRAAFKVLNDDLQMSIVEQIAHREPPAHLWYLHRRTAQLTDVAERSVVLVGIDQLGFAIDRACAGCSTCG